MRFRNSIELAKSSWHVLRADRELLWLPVLSGLSALVIVLLFAFPIFATSSFDENEGLSAGAIGLLFVAYFVLAYCTIFFNAALVSAAHERLSGGDPTVGSALRGAAKRAGRILPWALVTATFSLILRVIEERAGFLGRIVIALIGLAWAVVTFLVLPIIVIEGVGVRDAFRKSTNMLRATWGENLGAQFGFGLLGFLLWLPAIAVVAIAAITGSALVITSVVIVAVIWVALVTVVLAALSGIYQTALYHFAVDGQVPSSYFNHQTMQAAFGPRRRGR